MKCVICNQFFPPGLTVTTKDKKAVMCQFCIEGKDKIALPDDSRQGGVRVCTKKEIVEDYKKYIKQIKDNPNVKKMVVDDMVKKQKEM